ncbi:STAS domain-containing protein [Blastococcus saxobsidens]|uniref:STAS domain-containing protein n=1 Tax=Blastococcus saxobsidens TaxID=138336 RepID=A0A6L9W6Q0_9ACTN|nr:STAS domain-containing protein [Blastococcus saxobsidens]NEK87489.1 STAS domain-containing protein [Blastococcus saxobsidens]
MAAPASPTGLDHDAGWVPFQVSVDVASATVVVAGEFDRDHAPHVLDGLRSLTGSGRPRWVLDTERVTFCDAAGLRTLVTGHHLARRHGCQLVLERPSPCLHRLVVLVGLHDLLALLPGGPPAPDEHRSPPPAGVLRAGQRAPVIPTPAPPTP